MSAGATLAYALRTKKTIERNIFVDLLQKTSTAISPESVVYISMGGPFVQDQADVHSLVGLEDLISFDGSAWVVRRQEFNKPVSYITCLHLESSDIVVDLEGFFTRYVRDKRCAFWFDYTEPSERGAQLREMRSLISKLGHGDVLKMTINAQLSTLGLPADNNKTIKQYRFERLRDQLNDYFPADAHIANMTESELPTILGKAFTLACEEGLIADHDFMPLTSFRYADGHQMVSFCGVILERSRREQYLSRLASLGYGLPNSFADVSEICVPVLSLREKTEIDRLLFEMSPDELREALRVSLGETDAETTQLIDKYRHYYRFYPKFARISAI